MTPYATPSLAGNVVTPEAHSFIATRSQNPDIRCEDQLTNKTPSPPCVTHFAAGAAGVIVAVARLVCPSCTFQVTLHHSTGFKPLELTVLSVAAGAIVVLQHTHSTHETYSTHDTAHET